MPTLLYNALAEYSEARYKSIGASVREAVALLCGREGYISPAVAPLTRDPDAEPAAAPAPKTTARRKIAAKPKD
jgi:hypothetical protein